MAELLNKVSEPFLRVSDLKNILKKKSNNAPVGIAFCSICEEQMLVFEYKPECPRCHLPIAVTILKVKHRD